MPFTFVTGPCTRWCAPAFGYFFVICCALPFALAAHTRMEWQSSVDLDRLLQRVNAYAAHYGANKDVLGKVGELLRSDVARELLSLPREEWEDVLVRRRLF